MSRPRQAHEDLKRRLFDYFRRKLEVTVKDYYSGALLSEEISGVKGVAREYKG